MPHRAISPLFVVVITGVLAAGACKQDGGKDGGAPPARDAGDLGMLGGECVVECTTAADCCAGEQCGTSIFNYSCESGRCHQLGCVTDQHCADLPGGRCASLGSFAACGKGCRVAADCCPPLPAGVVLPDGVDRLTLTLDGGAQGAVSATFYRCGVYPQKFLCTGLDVLPDDAGTTGICVRHCTTDQDCPGIPFPLDDGGLAQARVDGGMMEFPADGGTLRLFQQACMPVFAGAGQCHKGCRVDADCCAGGSAAGCDSLGNRQVCVSGMCLADGCRADGECGGGTCQPSP
ncbi:MAG: hypothetical protein HY904_10150 [Deltaproteobacteria bacterium]|nr:hypothetical protein [Deltaproteobacteria bacterium]